MCNFLSALVTKDGRLLCNPFLDSHEQIIDFFGMQKSDKDKFIQKFVRVEFIPKDDDYFDVDNYKLRIDEDSKPDWFTEFEERITNELKDKIKSLIIDKATDKILCGGVYIVRDSKILWTRFTRMVVLKNSQVNEMRENSQVNTMRGNSQVNEMRGNSQVNAMRGNSQVNTMRGNSQVNTMRENSQVNEMWRNSQVNEMRENSQVNEMWRNSQVNEMWENSQVNTMRENSQVNTMRGNFKSTKKPKEDKR